MANEISIVANMVDYPLNKGWKPYSKLSSPLVADVKKARMKRTTQKTPTLG